MLLGAAGIAAAGLLWRRLAGEIPVPSGASSVAIRLGLALAALLPAAALLWAMLLVQMAARFIAGTFDPASGGDGAFLRVNQRVISNTVEQLLVFALALLALAAGLDAPRLPGALALAVVFTVARVAFWAGYLVAPAGRSLGMAATLAATAGAIGWAAAVWVRAAG